MELEDSPDLVLFIRGGTDTSKVELFKAPDDAEKQNY